MQITAVVPAVKGAHGLIGPDNDARSDRYAAAKSPCTMARNGTSPGIKCT